MASRQRVEQWIRSNPNQFFAIGLATLIIGLSIWTGIRSRVVAGDVALSRRSWDRLASQVAMIQQQFRMPNSIESAALAREVNRVGALGVPPGDQVNLVEMIGTLAETSALESVRVSAVARSDSAYVAEREIGGAQVKPATYALAVEFVGSFANAQKFVSSLPPSVSLSRLKAARREGGTQYHLVLSVYELDAKSGG